jgi:diadenosine tetraphosphate (Ap4A) HIT family hydrolase
MIYDDGIWTVEHALEPIPMVGWLVVVPHRHVETLADLTDQEAETLGPLLRRVTQAMTETLEPERVYMTLYAEKPGYQHLHVHLIPRFDDTPLSRRGPEIFRYMEDAARSGANQGDIEEARRLVQRLRLRLAIAAAS